MFRFSGISKTNVLQKQKHTNQKFYMCNSQRVARALPEKHKNKNFGKGP